MAHQARSGSLSGSKLPNQFKELRTPFLPIFSEALAQEEAGENPSATTGLGDAAISWILKNLQRLKSVDGQSLAVGPDEVALVLTEDGPYGDGPVLMRRHAHVLSTCQRLKTLERLGLIPSSQAVIDEIQASGRRVSRYVADRPATVAEGVRSDWKDGAEAVIAKGRDYGMSAPKDDENDAGNGASGNPGNGLE